MRRGPFHLSILRDALCVAGVAVITVQVLRRWVADSYMVESGSMQPVLHGDAANGDVVLVDKTARAADRRRHDLVVIEKKDEPGHQMIKRIAARGDDADACWIDIRQGDVWLGDQKQSVRREMKDPLAARPLRVGWAEWPGAEASTCFELGAAHLAAGELQLPPVAPAAASVRELLAARVRRERRKNGSPTPAGFVGTARAVDATWIDRFGNRSKVGEDAAVVDCGMELSLLGPVDALLGTIDGRNEALTFSWQPASGRLELWRNGETVGSSDLPAQPAAHRVEFGLLDDRAFFLVGDSTDAVFVFPRHATWQPDADPVFGKGPRSHVHVAVAGAVPLRASSLRVFIDPFVWREPIVGLPGHAGEWPRFVPPGHWFVPGDSTFDSRDSRHFGEVSMRLFLGAPRLVLGPWPRTRWLSP